MITLLEADSIAPTKNRASLDSTAATVATQDDNNDEEDVPYYEKEDWVPLMSNGKQRSPNQIRNELQRYIDKTEGVTMASMCRELGVSSNSLYKFMNPKNYSTSTTYFVMQRQSISHYSLPSAIIFCIEDPWNACLSESYWDAARFLERQRNKPKPKAGTKRSAEGSNEDDKIAKKAKATTKATAKAEAIALMERIVAYDAPEVSEKRVYDSCPKLIKRIKEFLTKDGVTKKDFCNALGGLNANSLNSFLASKKQDKAGCLAYRRAWVFFEKKRLMEGKPKGKSRTKNEEKYPSGFPLEGPSRYDL